MTDVVVIAVITSPIFYICTELPKYRNTTRFSVVVYNSSVSICLFMLLIICVKLVRHSKACGFYYDFLDKRIAASKESTELMAKLWSIFSV